MFEGPCLLGAHGMVLIPPLRRPWVGSLYLYWWCKLVMVAAGWIQKSTKTLSAYLWRNASKLIVRNLITHQDGDPKRCQKCFDLRKRHFNMISRSDVKDKLHWPVQWLWSMSNTHFDYSVHIMKADQKKHRAGSDEYILSCWLLPPCNQIQAFSHGADDVTNWRVDGIIYIFILNAKSPLV